MSPHFRVKSPSGRIVLETDDWLEAVSQYEYLPKVGLAELYGRHPSHDWARALSGTLCCRNCMAWDNGCPRAMAPCGYDLAGLPLVWHVTRWREQHDRAKENA